MEYSVTIGKSLLKLISPSHCDNWVDRLSHVYTVYLLTSVAAFVKTVQSASSPISCWIPAEFDANSEAYKNYVNAHCWIQNTYNVPFHEDISTDVSHRQNKEITYYQWVPIVLLIQVLLFKIPHIIWVQLRKNSGLDLQKFIEIAEETQCLSRQERESKIEVIVYSIVRWIDIRQQCNRNVSVRLNNTLSKITGCFGEMKRGTFLTALYLIVKCLYLANVVGQIFLLNAFITTDKNVFAIEWLKSNLAGSSFVESRRFPRVNLCDFQIRQMNNIKRYTVQCVLKLNFYNEKIFLILWFWFCLLAIITFFSMMSWLYLILWKRNNYRFVMKYLKLGKDTMTTFDKKEVDSLANEKLRSDGCFLVRLIGMNSSDIVVVDILKKMFLFYEKQATVPKSVLE